MDRDGMSNIYRGPSIDASYQVSVHLAQWFQSRRFLKIGQSETRIACGGHVFVNGSGRNQLSLQSTFHRCFLPSFGSFGKAFQRRIFFQKSSNQKQELSMVTIFVNGSGRNEQSQQRTFHRCFLPSFGSIGQTVSEEKNIICSIVFYFLLIFFTNFQLEFEKRQRPCLMAVRVIIHGLKENYICIVPLQFGSSIGSVQYLKK